LGIAPTARNKGAGIERAPLTKKFDVIIWKMSPVRKSAMNYDAKHSKTEWGGGFKKKRGDLSEREKEGVQNTVIYIGREVRLECARATICSRSEGKSAQNTRRPWYRRKAARMRWFGDIC